MANKKQKVEFRYYEIPEKEPILALLGEDWIRTYGEGIDYLHFHNYMEIGLCHYGEGEVILDEKHYRFTEESIVIIPPNVPHTTNSDKGTKAYWEWLYLDIDTILLEMYQKEPMSVKKMRDKIYDQPLYLSKGTQPVMSEIINNMVREMGEKKYLYKESVKGLLRMAVVEMLRMIDFEYEMNKRKQKTVIITPAMEYVEEHYAENVKIIDMANACNISESHFRRVFLEIMNMRPLDYVNLVRIQRSCELIKKTDYSMEDIAYKTGFINVSTFNRNFKRILDKTPYQWKKTADSYEGKLLNYRISAQKGW